MFTKVPFIARLLHDDGASNAILLDDGISYLLWASAGDYVVYSYKPLINYTESIEWKTNIISTKSKEQRICIRRNPRTIFNFSGYFTDIQYREIKAILRSLNKTPVILPDWNSGTIIHTILNTDTEILFDTSLGNYADGQKIVLYDGIDYYKVATIDNVQSDRIVLTESIGESFTNVYICPAYEVIIRNGMSFNRQGNNIVIGNFIMESVDNYDYSATLSYPTYRGYPVWLECNPILGGINDSIARDFDSYDNEQGIPALEFKYNYVGRTFTLNFSTETILEISALKRFLHTMKGRYKTFWLPTLNHDIKLHANITNGSTTMQVTAFGYGYYYDGEVSDILIELKNGTRYYNRILSSTKDIDVETFTVQTPMFPINVSDVKRIMFLHHVRFDADTIELRHITKNVTQVSTVVREVRDTVYDL